MTRLLPACCLLLTVVALLPACKSTPPVNTVQRENERADPDIVEPESIIFDRNLGRKLNLVRVNESVVSGDLQKAQVMLQNRTKNALNVNYQWEWYDDAGMVIYSPTRTFKPITIRGGDTVALTSVAPTSRAVDFKLRVTEGR